MKPQKFPKFKREEIPFEIFTAHNRLQKEIDKRQEYVQAIKKRAKDNLNLENEYLRISRSNKFKIPLKPDFNEYTPEQKLLEAWEQFYYENPDHLEMKGISKKKNAETGLTYYETGDPVIDEMEKAFSRGEFPNMSSLLPAKEAPSAGSMPIFETIDGKKVSAPIHAEVRANSNVDAKIDHEDFTSDAWVKGALEDDPVLKKLSERFGAKNG